MTTWKVGPIRNLVLIVSWPFWRLTARARHFPTGNRGMACGYTVPYGFVPEAGCPIHDRDEE